MEPPQLPQQPPTPRARRASTRPDPVPKRARIMDLVFLLGVLGKALDGVAELIGGAVLFALSPGQLKHTAQLLTAKELGEDPDDLLVNLIVHGVAHLHTQGTAFLGVYLLLHGVVKIAIVVALIIGSRRVYPWAIGALLVFLVYQVYELFVAPSPLVIVLTVLDAALVLLTWREWHHHRTLRDTLRTTCDWMLRRSPDQGSHLSGEPGS